MARRRPRLTQREQGIAFADISSMFGLHFSCADAQLDLFRSRAAAVREWVSIRLAVLEASFHG